MAYDDIEDVEFGEGKRVSFDTRGFLFKLLKFWKLFVLCIGIHNYAYLNTMCS